jgi:DNA-binding beta-propeller fold protein YncE
MPRPFFASNWVVVLGVAVLCSGCGNGQGQADIVWGQKGRHAGDFVRPRAIAVDCRSASPTIYVVDFAGRIQAFDERGRYLRGWSTPTIVNGRPAGLGMGRDGRLLVADSHYNQVLVYSPEGELVQTIRGKEGQGPGPFAYLSDVVQDGEGNFYIVEFGDSDRIQKFSADGRYLKHWGSHGSEPGQFCRPRGAALGLDGSLYVADSCNHRIQVFDRDGKLLRLWGEEGRGLGQLRYPYDVALGPDGDVYVAEFGNHRVQRFRPDGTPVGAWGLAGRDPGCLNSPWGVAVDGRGRVYVVDTENHRVQRMGL